MVAVLNYRRQQQCVCVCKVLKLTATDELLNSY